jgi:hypothetical protein
LGTVVLCARNHPVEQWLTLTPTLSRKRERERAALFISDE